MRKRISTGTEVNTQIGLFVFTSEIEVTHKQKQTFKRNRQQNAMNKADFLQGERVDIKDERKQERQQERERKRLERKLNRGLY